MKKLLLSAFMAISCTTLKAGPTVHCEGCIEFDHIERICLDDTNECGHLVVDKQTKELILLAPFDRAIPLAEVVGYPPFGMDGEAYEHMDSRLPEATRHINPFSIECEGCGSGEGSGSGSGNSGDGSGNGSGNSIGNGLGGNGSNNGSGNTIIIAVPGSTVIVGGGEKEQPKKGGGGE